MIKNTIVLSFFLINSCIIYSQSPEIQWEKTFGGTSNDEANCIVATSDGGYIVAGYSLSDDFDIDEDPFGNYGHQGGKDVWVVKINKDGNMEWQRSYGGSGDDVANSIVETPNQGGFVVVGYTTSTDGDITSGPYNQNASGNSIWILKITDFGFLSWEESYHYSVDDVANSVALFGSNSYIVTGRTRAGTYGKDDLFAMRISPNGGNNIIDYREFGGAGDDEGNFIIETHDGGVAIAGHKESPTSSDDFWVLKLSGGWLGFIWQETYGGTNIDVAESIQEFYEDGNWGMVVVGWTKSNNGDVSQYNGNTDAWVLRFYQNNRNAITETTLGGSGTDYGNEIQTTTDGGFILASSSTSNNIDVESGNKGGVDFWIAKLDDNLSIEWEKSMGGSNLDEAQSIKQVSDNEFIVAGFSNSDDQDVNDGYPGATINTEYWVVKIEVTPKLGDLQCNNSVNLSGNFMFDAVDGAQNYQMIITNMYNSYDSYTSYSYGSNNYIPKYNFYGLQYYNYYLVKIRAKVNGSWGSYGPECSIYCTPGAMYRTTRTRNAQNEPLTMSIYPNPSKQIIGFNLNLKGLTDERGKIFISIYDMVGKLVYSKTADYDSSELDLSINSNESITSGIYQVNVLINNKTLTEKILIE